MILESLTFWFVILVLVSLVIGWRYGSKAGVIAWGPTLVLGLAAFLQAAVIR